MRVADTDHRLREPRLHQTHQVFCTAEVTPLTYNRLLYIVIQDFFILYLPRRSKHSHYVLAGVHVDQQGEALVGLLHHDQVQVVPGDDPPLQSQFVVP